MTKPLDTQALKIPGLQIERMIAQGGMSEVYLAEQKSLGRQVAVKVLDPRGADAQFSARFFQEAKLVASLSHSNIITIYDFGTLDDGRLFISMEYLAKGDLEERLTKGITEEDTLRILHELAHALSFIHKKNIVHRDIKPANILFRQDGSLVLTDFGIAKEVDNRVSMTQAGATIGSPAYCSPEQSQGQPLDLRSDIYSTGVMLVEMLTGSNPYKSDTGINTAIKHIQMPIPVLQGRLSRYQPLIEKMLAKKPRDRFGSMLDALDFLDKLAGSVKDNKKTPEKSSAVNAALMNRCAEDGKAFSIATWKIFQETINKKLEEMLETTRNNMQQWQLQELSRNLRKKNDELSRDFQNHLSMSFQDFSLGQYKPDQTLSAKAIDLSKLSLMANEELEQNIAASTLIRQVEGKHNDELSLLHARLCHLIKKELPVEACPVGPYQLAKSFKKTIQTLELEKQTKSLFFKTLEKNLLADLGVFYQALNKTLVDAGVLPKLTLAELHKELHKEQHKHHQPVSVANEHSPATTNQTVDDASNKTTASSPRYQSQQTLVPDAQLPSEAYQQQLFTAIRQMQQVGFSTPPADYSAAPTYPGAMNDSQVFQSSMPSSIAAQQPVYSQSDIVTALHGLVQGVMNQGGIAQGGMAHSASVAFEEMRPGNLQPWPIQPLDVVMDAIAKVSPDEGDEPKQLNENDASVIDLVGMIFEYMLQDEDLPNSVKALLSYLQVPYIKVALLDPEMFAKPTHPARALLDKLSEAGALWLSKEGYGQFRVFDEIKKIVHRILNEFSENAGLFDQLLIEFQDFVFKVERRAEQLERLSTQRVQAEQHLQKVKAHVHDRIKSRVKGEQIPSQIVAMLLYPWFDYLTSIMLRHGEASEEWSQGLQIVETLLWSIKPKETQHEIHRLNNLRDFLNKQIQKGFDTIGFDQIKGQSFLDKISELHELAINNNTVALKVTEHDRVEISRIEKELTVRELIIQPPSVVEMSADEMEIVDKLRLIEFGTWFEFDNLPENEFQKLKVAWFNHDNLTYLMVNSAGKQVAMLTALEIARQMISKTARIIAGSAKPFFERALEAIYKRMAESMSAAA